MFQNRTINQFDGTGQDHIENEELSLNSVGNIVLSSTGMLHSTNITQVFDILEVTSHGLIQPIESSIFDQLSDDFQGFLITPLVNLGHIDIINEQGHLFSLGGSKVLTHLEVTFNFDIGLESQWFSGG